ncbi:MAG: hypothetical protein CL727_03665 [Chloroflexi bacterium]|nr:hypothetical protein [Chloroflexota bacterium]
MAACEATTRARALEVAPTIVFLTTDEAQYITGDIIRVDGGMAI